MKPDSKDIFRIRSYKEWEIDYSKLKEEGNKLWEQTGLHQDIRKGWQEAAKENKLFAFGPYPVPLDVIESIEDQTDRMLTLADPHRIWRKQDCAPGYIHTLKDNISKLERDLKMKQTQIDTLLNVIADLRTNKPIDEIEIEDDSDVQRSKSDELINWNSFSL